MVSAGKNKSGFNTSTVVLSTVAAALFLYAVSLFLQGGFQALAAREYDAKTYGPTNETVAAHETQQQAILNERTRWLDEEQGKLCLPIDDAIDRLAPAPAADAAGNADAAQ